MSLLDLALMASPHRCAGCGVARERLCSDCAAALEPLSVPRVPGAESVLAAFAYEGAARSLVLDLKLRGDRGAAQPLVAGLVRTVATIGLSADVLTWVPGRPRENRGAGSTTPESLPPSWGAPSGCRWSHCFGVPPSARIRLHLAPRSDGPTSRGHLPLVLAATAWGW
jgi:predicted amidophosphoribosyltransferase